MKRTFKVCSNDISLNTELNHLETVFTNNNDYPKRVINDIIKSENEKNKTNTNYEPSNTNNHHTGVLLYAGHKGETIINKMTKHKTTIPNTKPPKSKS